MDIRNITTIAAFFIALQLAGCSSSEHDVSDPSSGEPRESLTAAQAKRAVIELVRANPKMFIGAPDPDLLAGLPLKDRGSGEFAFGAFVVYPIQRLYTADIGFDSPEMYSYRGSFESKGDKWIASEPRVSRFHRLPADSQGE